MSLLVAMVGFSTLSSDPSHYINSDGIFYSVQFVAQAAGVGETRVLRLWRREGLKVPKKRRKRRCLDNSRNACHGQLPQHKDDVWTWDFIFDRTTSGSPLQWLSIVDEHILTKSRGHVLQWRFVIIFSYSLGLSIPSGCSWGVPQREPCQAPIDGNARLAHANQSAAPRLPVGLSLVRRSGGAIWVQKREMDADTARRGTVEHRVFEGNKGRAFDGELAVKINCTANAGRLDEQVPYALAVTLEIAEPSDVTIYEEVRDRVRPRVKITPATAR